MSVTCLASILEKCRKTVNKTASEKQKYDRADNGPYMNKEIKKAIMIKKRLRNRYLKGHCGAIVKQC